jgi:hypothetical protein
VQFFLDNWMLIAVALSAGGMLLWPALSGGGPGALTADGAVQLINREKAVVIDVCETLSTPTGMWSVPKTFPWRNSKPAWPQWSKTRPPH